MWPKTTIIPYAENASGFASDFGCACVPLKEEIPHWNRRIGGLAGNSYMCCCAVTPILNIQVGSCQY